MSDIPKRDRMKMERTPSRTADPEVRSRSFDEVNVGYTSALAVLEASRCLNCKRPVCIEGCPVGVRIDEFVALVADGRFTEAASVVHHDNPLPAVCGRVCPQETQCEEACVLNKKGRPIAIGALERFVADRELDEMAAAPRPRPEPTGKSVAVVGSGPAGLACAGDLNAMGHQVTVFEALHELGGVLAYGIPAFRLPKPVVKAEIDRLGELGVRFERDVLVGVSPTVEELRRDEGFDAVFVGTGAGLPRFPGIEGENLIGVYSANEFLTRVNLMHANEPGARTPVYDLVDRSVVVIGGGNTAVDAARTALRLGARSVRVLYRRSKAEMPARAEEIEHAEEEGIALVFQVSPVRFDGTDGWLNGVTIQHMTLGPPDEEGRARPIPIEGRTEDIACEVAIVAIGNQPNPILANTTPGLTTSDWGTIEVDPSSGATSIPGVFAGGDIATGGATVILALGAGRRAAAAIDSWLAEGHPQQKAHARGTGS